MSEIDNDYNILLKASEQQSEAFRHHAEIMEYLQRTGFKPNPEPQVDMATKLVDPKQLYVNPGWTFSM